MIKVLTISIVKDLKEFNKKNKHQIREREQEAIIHNDSWHFSKGDNKNLKPFLKELGIEPILIDDTGNVKYYRTYTHLKERYFWGLSELPEGAKKIKGYSNGSIVDCYYLNDGKTLNIYRPNPNAKNVYNEMNLDGHIKFIKSKKGNFIF